MMSLFSSFDVMYFNFKFLFLFFFMIFILNFYYNSSLILIINSMKFLESFILSLKNKMFNKSSVMFFLTLFTLILTFNFMSIFCYVFPITSQYTPILFFSLLFCISFMIFSIFNNSKLFFLHLIPESSPLILSIFLFVIEIVSIVIRPITLSVRLVANILAGHLLMILLFNFIHNFNFFFASYFILNLVEMLVSLIQSYIMLTMITLYYSDIH